jgi:hypothetical protein
MNHPPKPSNQNKLPGKNNASNEKYHPKRFAHSSKITPPFSVLEMGRLGVASAFLWYYWG